MEDFALQLISEIFDGKDACQINDPRFYSVKNGDRDKFIVVIDVPKLAILHVRDGKAIFSKIDLADPDSVNKAREFVVKCNEQTI